MRQFSLQKSRLGFTFGGAPVSAQGQNMFPSSLIRRVGVLGGMALFGTSCGLDFPTLSPEAQAVAGDTTESEPSVTFASSLAFLPAITLDATSTTLADAVNKQADLPNLLSEPACLTVQTEGNVVTYSFDECPGPWGLATVSGLERATFTAVSAGIFDVELRSEGLTIDGKEASHEGVARVDVTGDEGKHVHFTGAFAGSTSKGRDVATTSDLDLTLLELSIRLNGEATIDIGLRGLEVSVEDLSRNGPAGTCPDGRVVVTTRLTRLTLTLDFDGSETVSVDSARGGHGTIELTCTPAEQ